MDVVAELVYAFESDLSRLSPFEQENFHAMHPTALYDWTTFRGDVLDALRSRFGVAVREGKKAIRVEPLPGQLPIDVLVAITFRTYYSYPVPHREGEFRQGIAFFVPEDNRWVVNYPMLHLENGERKNSFTATNGRYKPSVRVIKNIRTHMVEQGRLDHLVAPSYFLECLWYNLPDELFSTSHTSTLQAALDWLPESDVEDLVCQNGIVPLCGPSPEQWSEDQLQRFIQALETLWSDW